MNAVVTKMAPLDMQLCVPEDWADEQVKTFADDANPSGTDDGWIITREGDRYLMGDHERAPCRQRVGCVHIMLHC